MTEAVGAGVPRVAIVGIHGYGASHVLHALRLVALGRIRLVGLVDPVGGSVTRDGVTIASSELPAVHADLDSLLAVTGVDVVIVATPLHTHAALALASLEAGADVLLEKPPVTKLDDYEALVAAARRSGRRIQVGFQSLGSRALSELRSLIAAGALGEVEAIGAEGSWTRDRTYWTRSAWAGKRTLGGNDVVDGAVTNPFAHAVMTALSVAGLRTPDSVGEIETELWHVNDIEADDTSALRIHPAAAQSGGSAGAAVISCAFTLAGPREDRPSVSVRGTAGRARLYYVDDELELELTEPDATAVRTTTQSFARDDLLENLLDHRTSGVPLIAPLEDTGGFVRVVEAIRLAEVRELPSGIATWLGSGQDARPVIAGIDAVVRRAVDEGKLFRELGVEWAK